MAAEASVCGHEGCQKSFTKAKLLEAHKKTDHPELYPFACDETNCDYRTDAQRSLREHKRNSHGVVQYPCEVYNCDKDSAKLDHYRRHLRTIHKGNMPCTFPGCSFLFGSQVDLDQHSPVHQGAQPHACAAQGCGRSFANVAALHTHEVNDHGRSLCLVCPKTVKTFALLLLHAECHNGNVGCSNCNITKAPKAHWTKAHAYTTIPLTAELVYRSSGSNANLAVQNIQQTASQPSQSAPLTGTNPTQVIRQPASWISTFASQFPARINSIRTTNLGSVHKQAPSDSARSDATALLSWSNALYSLPSISTVLDTSSAVLATVKKLLRASSLRQLDVEVTVKASAAGKILDSITLIMNGQSSVFHLGRFMVGAEHDDRFASYLRRLAEKADSPPSKLKATEHLWLLRGAFSLVADDLSKQPESSSNALISLPIPRLDRDQNGQLTCYVPLWGYGRPTETSKANETEWNAQWELDVDTMLRCQPIRPLYAESVNWLQSSVAQTVDP